MSIVTFKDLDIGDMFNTKAARMVKTSDTEAIVVMSSVLTVGLTTEVKDDVTIIPLYNQSITKEHFDLLRAFQAENKKCYDIANRLDAFNPEIPGAFTGTPSDRILRQITAQNIKGFQE